MKLKQSLSEFTVNSVAQDMKLKQSLSEFTMNPVAQDLVGGDSLSLSCKISGSAQVTVTWQKNGVSISSENSIYSQQDAFSGGVTTSTLTSANAGTS